MPTATVLYKHRLTSAIKTQKRFARQRHTVIQCVCTRLSRRLESGEGQRAAGITTKESHPHGDHVVTLWNSWKEHPTSPTSRLIVRFI